MQKYAFSDYDRHFSFIRKNPKELPNPHNSKIVTFCKNENYDRDSESACFVVTALPLFSYGL